MGKDRAASDRSEYQRRYHEANRERRSALRKRARQEKTKKRVYPTAPCKRCGAPFPVKPKFRVFCSKRCRRQSEAHIYHATAAAPREYPGTCSICGSPFIGRTTQQRMCSKRCRARDACRRSDRRAAVRRRTDPAFAVKSACRNRLNEMLKRWGGRKPASTAALVGCSFDELVVHLEAQFAPGMSWLNRGVRGWHIDHIKPCRDFDFTDPAQVSECFHFSNLRPLWAADNLARNWRERPARAGAA